MLSKNELIVCSFLFLKDIALKLYKMKNNEKNIHQNNVRKYQKMEAESVKNIQKK